MQTWLFKQPLLIEGTMLKSAAAIADIRIRIGNFGISPVLQKLVKHGWTVPLSTLSDECRMLVKMMTGTGIADLSLGTPISLHQTMLDLLAGFSEAHVKTTGYQAPIKPEIYEDVLLRQGQQAFN